MDARTNHLSRLIRDLVDRLRSDTQIAATSSSAREHGVLRRKQRYTVSNADRGGTNPASEPLYHPEPQSRRTRFHQSVARGNHYRGRSGFSVETGNALLHGICGGIARYG